MAEPEESAAPTSPPTQLAVDFAVEIETRDGVRLMADVYRPAAPGRWPVIIQRNPYDRTDAGMGSMVIVDPAWLARQGFAVIIQDTRGRGGSDGDWDSFHDDADDGYDCVEWAASQPWSNGSVGIYGSSGMGMTTYKTVAAHPPHLRAAVAIVGAPDMEVRWPGGPFELSFMTWYGLMMAIDTVRRIKDPEVAGGLTQRILASMGRLPEIWNALPLTDIDGISDPDLVPFWGEWVRTEPGDPNWHRSASLSQDPSLGEVALLQVGGYRDFIGTGMFELASAQGGNPRHRFIAGPWAHRGVYSGATGARELPETSSPAGPLGWGPVLAAWFDIHLRGGDGSAFPLGLMWLQGDPVRYYVEGQNAWVSAPSWPPPGETRDWLLASGGDARSAAGDGRLIPSAGAPPAEGSDTFRVDPRDPFPTCGGGLGLPFQGPDGIQDQRTVDGRPDVLVYTSSVLDSAITIVGSQELVLYLDSSAPDADIHAKIIDVEPDGFAYNVTEGALRARYRAGGTTDWLTPGTPQELRVWLHDTAHTFRPGHRIRVMISGANFPRFSRNLHTTTVPELGSLDEAVTADLAIHHSARFPSRIVLRTSVDND